MGGPFDALSAWVPALGALLGTGTIAGIGFSLPDWARRRAELMEQITARASES